MTKKPAQLDLDEILVDFLFDGSHKGGQDLTKIKAAIKQWAISRLPEKQYHNKDVLAHYNKPDCCNRVEGFNLALSEMKEALNE